MGFEVILPFLRALFRLSTPTPLSKHWLGSPVAFSSPASSCPTRMRSICCCISKGGRAVAMSPNSCAFRVSTPIPTRFESSLCSALTTCELRWRSTSPRSSSLTASSRVGRPNMLTTAVVQRLARAEQMASPEFQAWLPL